MNLPQRAAPITKTEMLAVISDWSRCLRESHEPAPRRLWPTHIHRELAVLAALATLVRNTNINPSTPVIP